MPSISCNFKMFLGLCGIAIHAKPSEEQLKQKAERREGAEMCEGCSKAHAWQFPHLLCPVVGWPQEHPLGLLFQTAAPPQQRPGVRQQRHRHACVGPQGHAPHKDPGKQRSIDRAGQCGSAKE